MCGIQVDLQLAADDENGESIRFTRDVIRSYVVYRLRNISQVARSTFFKDNKEILCHHFLNGQRVPEEDQLIYYERMNRIRAYSMNEGTIRSIGQTGRSCCGKSSLEVQRTLDSVFTRTFCGKALPEITWLHIVYFMETLVSIMNADHSHYSYGADQLAINFAHKPFNNRGETLNDWLEAVGGWERLLITQNSLKSSTSEESVDQSTASRRMFQRGSNSAPSPRARSFSPTKRRDSPPRSTGKSRGSGDSMAFSLTTSRRLSQVSSDILSFGMATASDRGTSMWM